MLKLKKEAGVTGLEADWEEVVDVFLTHAVSEDWRSEVESEMRLKKQWKYEKAAEYLMRLEPYLVALGWPRDSAQAKRVYVEGLRPELRKAVKLKFSGAELTRKTTPINDL